VYANGGARTGGDKARTVPKRLAAFAAHGVTVVSIDYRLAPDAVFPQQLRDLKDFWMAAHPRAEPRARHRRLGILGRFRIFVLGVAVGGAARAVPLPRRRRS
jgi:acetyl esterase/lipase